MTIQNAILANIKQKNFKTGVRPQMLSKHLFHFAMVHDEFAKTGDIVKGLLPLFTPILSNKEGEDFLPENFCRDVNSAYGIDMHPYVAEDLAPKLVKAGILKIIQDARRKDKYIIDSAPEIDDEKLKNEISLIFQEFEGTTKLLLNKAKLSIEIDFSKEFTSRLARVDTFLDNNHSPYSHNETNDIIDYAFVRFVKHIETKGGPLKEALNKVYSGSILAEVVLSIKEPSIDNNSINEKYFYIDAPILLNLLGLNDEYSVKCSLKLIEQIKQNKGILTTTSSYLDEAQTAIKHALENYQNKGSRYTSLDFYLFRGSDNLLNARTAQNKIKEILTKNHTFNLDNNIINLNQHISSQRAVSLKEKIINELNWYKNSLARDNDAEAVTNVVARHKYCSIKNMAESNSFLVTQNEHLIVSSNNVLYSMQAFTRPEMTPLLSEKKLAMLLWVISGGAGENISSLTLISSCTRAMEMHKDVFYKIQSFIKKLPQEKVSLYEEIISNDRALYCLIDEVGSNYSILNDNNVEDHLIRARENYLNQEKEEKEEEERKIEALSKKLEKVDSDKKKAHQALIERAASELSKENKNTQLQQKVEELHDKVMQIEEKSAAEKTEKNKEIDNLKENHSKELTLKIKETQIKSLEKLGNKIETGIQIILSIFLAYLCYITSGLALPPTIETPYFQVREEGVKLVKLLIATLPLIATWKLPDIVFGKPIKWISKKIASYIIET